MTDDAAEIATQVARLDERVRQVVNDLLPSEHANPSLAEYYALLREYPARAGKGIRSRITLLSALAHGGTPESVTTPAAAIELFQDWVLIHDDIEDDSDERRGSPALHKLVGVPVAINVGDGLHVYMWDLLLRDKDLPRAVLAEFVHTIHRTAEGQHLDLSWVLDGRLDITEDEYLEMVRLKTALYTVVTPLRLGAICAGVQPGDQLAAAGEKLGVAFQIRDDVLNLLGGEEYGKEFAGDLYEGKRTLILAHLLSHASAGHRDEAMERLSRPRRERTANDVERLLQLIRHYRSLEYAQEVAAGYADEGLELFQEASQQLPGRGAQEQLRVLLETMAKRTS